MTLPPLIIAKAVFYTYEVHVERLPARMLALTAVAIIAAALFILLLVMRRRR